MALGAASFVLTGHLLGGDGGDARMGAQVVSGSGFLAYAALSAGLVIAANLLLRPLVQAINR